MSVKSWIFSLADTKLASFYLINEWAQQKIFRWIHVNGRNPNGNVQLSVAYLGPPPTLNSHQERLAPLTPVARVQIYSKGKFTR